MKRVHFKRKKPRVSFLRKKAFWLGVLFLFLGAGIFWGAVVSPFFEIQEVRVQGVKELKEENILSALREHFWQEFLFIPQNSILLFDGREAGKELSLKFPLIDSVSLETSLPKTLTVKIEEREQAATWCLEELCLAMDGKGVLYKETAGGQDHIVVRSFGQPVLGEELVEPSLLAALLSFAQTFEASGELSRFSIASFEITEGGMVIGATKEGWEVLLDVKENIAWQTTKLQQVLEQEVPLQKRGELEYIDLRFGDQAYLKYQD